MEKEPANKKWQTVLFGDSNSMDRFPLLNRAILGFVAVSTVVYVLFMIAPVVTLLAKTPLYHIQTFLGILGGMLLCVDLVTNKGVWRGPWCVLLYVICAAAVLASLRTMSYGIKDNLFDLCWVVIQFSLIYSWASRTEGERRAVYLRRLYTVNLLIWTAACCVSVYQYVAQIGYRYISDPVSTNPELTRQGFWGRRLFGVFTGLDYAVYVSLALIIIGIYFFLKEKRTAVRVGLVFAMAVMVLYIILSGSRSVLIAAALYAFFFTWLMVRNRMKRRHVREIMAMFAASVCVVAVCVGGYLGLRHVMELVPKGVHELVPHTPWEKGDDPVPGTTLEEDPVELSRDEELEGDVSNNRFSIWKDYLSLWKAYGLTGLSLSNYNDYIIDHYPDLYIVDYFRDNYAHAEKSDMVYECHNNYIFVLVSTGLVGLLCFLTFLVLGTIRVLRFIWNHPQVPLEVITVLALVCVGLVEALFMNSVFLKINATSFIFWFSAGLLLNLTAEKRPEKAAA